jgi:hypothetical protein
MQRSKESALKWIEGSIVNYLYGGISSEGLTARIQKVRAQYGVSREEILRIVESIESKHVTYFGGRYRLAFAVIGKKPTVASFSESRKRAKLIASIRDVVSRA